MKVFLLFLVLLFAPTAARPVEPYIVHQQSNMIMHDDASPTWERVIQIRNPRDRAVWVYIECESRLTTNPIGLAGRHTSTITLPDIPPGEGCLINHWYTQRGTEPPKEWRP